jgi:hypothetical protein
MLECATIAICPIPPLYKTNPATAKANTPPATSITPALLLLPVALALAALPLPLPVAKPVCTAVLLSELVEVALVAVAADA